MGGKCCKCGSTDLMEIDHVDPATKLFCVTSGLLYSLDRLLAEVAKCQLLCRECHKKKTLDDMGFLPARGTHGRESTYKFCKCDVCRKAHAAYMKDYRKRKSALIA